MAYQTPIEVLVGVLNKLENQRDSLLKKIAELTLRIKYLDQSDEDVFDILLDLGKEKEKSERKLQDVELQIRAIRKVDNGSNLDKFLTVEE